MRGIKKKFLHFLTIIGEKKEKYVEGVKKKKRIHGKKTRGRNALKLGKKYTPQIPN